MARRRRRGGLTDEDRALWGQVARGVTPLDAAERSRLAPEAADPPTPPQTAPPRNGPGGPGAAQTPPPIPHDHALVPVRPPVTLPPGFRPGATAPRAPAAPPRLLGPAERLAAQPVSMDAGTHRRLSRGKLRPEARIDLHGMTLAVAKAELTGFILSAQASGRRLVLVITGKGKGDHGPLPTRSGALRHEVPHWLHMAPLGSAVMQVVPAHFRHGGGGAYYVWLRRMR